MSKKDIYADSYTAEPKDNSQIVESLRVHKMDQGRIKQLGQMLKEERALAKELQRRINRLEEEKRTLAAAVAKSHRR